MNRLALAINAVIALAGCTTTLEFGSMDGGAQDASFDASLGDVQAADAQAADAGPSPSLAACRSACESQQRACLSFNASLCFSQCDGADDARRDGFVQCAQNSSSSVNCNVPGGDPTCFSVLTGGSESEARCRNACSRYESCDFLMVSGVCEGRCLTRLPGNNEAFVVCVNNDLQACTLRCL